MPTKTTKTTKRPAPTTEQTLTTYHPAVPVESIHDDPDNERKQLRNIDELADNIKREGLLEPIRIYHIADTAPPQFCISSGHRRLAATRKAGLHTIPAFIVPAPVDDTQKHIHRLIANLLRDDLNDIEKARGYRQALDRPAGEFNQSTLADHLNISQAQIANTLRLLTLPPYVIKLIETNRLTGSHGLELLAIKEPIIDYQGNEKEAIHAAQIRLATLAEEGQWTIKATREAVQSLLRQHKDAQNHIASIKRQQEEEERRKATGQTDPKQAKQEAKTNHEAQRNKLRERRIPLVKKTIQEAISYDPEQGPTMEQLRFTAHYINYRLNNWQSDTRPEQLTATIDAATSPEPLYAFIVHTALSMIKPDYWQLRINDYTNNGTDTPIKWAIDTWQLNERIAEAIKTEELNDIGEFDTKK